MSSTLLFLIGFALLMFFMHRGHGGMGGCGGHSQRQHGEDNKSGQSAAEPIIHHH